MPDQTEKLLAAGQAALMLGEAMLLALVEAGVLDKERVIEATETVISAKRALVLDGEPEAISAAAVGLLTDIANSVAAAAVKYGPQPADPPRLPERADSSH